MSKSKGLMPPVHPGEVLREDFMKPLVSCGQMEAYCSSLKPTVLIGSGLRGSHRFVGSTSTGGINVRSVTPSSNA
jgi:hypothetical protein